MGRSVADTTMGGSATDAVVGGPAANAVVGGPAADAVVGGSAADAVMGGSAAGGPQVVLLHGDSSFAQPVWLCSCSQITAPIIPTCPSMMGVVVFQQLQGHIDR